MNQPLTRTELETLYSAAITFWHKNQSKMATTLFNIAENNRGETEFDDYYRVRCLDSFGHLVK